jgi:hypothetical protein
MAQKIVISIIGSFRAWVLERHYTYLDISASMKHFFLDFGCEFQLGVVSLIEILETSEGSLGMVPVLIEVT